MTSTSVPLMTTPARTRRLTPWLVLWLTVAAVEVALLVNNAYLDTLFWNATNKALGKPIKFLRWWETSRTLGEPVTTLIILLLIATYAPRRWLHAGMALMATSFAGALGALIRMTNGRFRPTHTSGANHWELFRGFFDGKDLAFPSGHATLAFATAAVLCYLSPRGRWIFIFVAAACAFSRVAMAAHFYADVIFGSALGWTVAWFTCELFERRFVNAQK